MNWTSVHMWEIQRTRFGFKFQVEGRYGTTAMKIRSKMGGNFGAFMAEARFVVVF